MSGIRVVRVTGGEQPPSEDLALPHVLLVVDQLPKALGGGERIVLKLAKLLPNYGYRTSILTFSAHPESEALVSPPCPIFLLALQRTYDFAALGAAIEFGKFLRKHDVTIVQTFFESSDIWGGFVTKVLSKARLIWSRRDMGILRTGKHRIAYRLMSGMPDAVFAVSEEVRRYCIDVDQIDAVRVETIYNGSDLPDPSRGDSETAPSTGTHVATIGNIRRVKGHDIFIKAAAIVSSQVPNVSFSIAGDVLEPEYFSELQKLVRDLNLSPQFLFSGAIRSPYQYLSDVDIFILPSRSEGFSNAIVEAMAVSIPVVATDVGGNAEAVTNGVTGFLVPPEDPSALAEAIMKLISNPGQARTMGIQGRALAAESFSTDGMMKKITRAYGALLS